MGEFIEVERDGRLMIITMNRPKSLNSLHTPACIEMSHALDELQNDPDLWIGIITGAGDRAFCSGHDLVDDFFEPMPATGWAGMAKRQGLNKPIISAVNGYAMGGGFEIALMSDIVVAEERAVFGLSEPRWGFCAFGGGAQNLPHRLPKPIAMGMLLTGNRMGAAEAARWGLVNEVVPNGTSVEAARRWADDIMKCSPAAVRFTKQVAMMSLEPELTHRPAFDIIEDLKPVLFAMEDTKEGMKAFAEKRPPVWTGR
uniref:Putative Carnitinyl-CoA dehydratase n=1 Tax=Sphingomonas sp. KSM1 TaxID=1228049 RepID=M1VB77_9SPHN|nr:putative Carnitinyl-CoA dehydratase [Sphingomonas sp. KSM1]